MAVPVVESWTVNKNTDGNPSATVDALEPTGLATDDLCVIIAMNDDNTSTDQYDDVTYKPTGFTLINHAGSASSDAHVGAWYRIITGSESWPITVTSQSQDDQVVWALRISGIDTTTPIHKTGADYVSGTSGSHGVTGVTTTLNDCLIVYLLGADGSDTLPHSVSGTGFTETDEDGVGNAQERIGGSWGTRSLATAGASGTATVSLSSNDGAAGFQFAIAPAAAASGNPWYYYANQ